MPIVFSHILMSWLYSILLYTGCLLSNAEFRYMYYAYLIAFQFLSNLDICLLLPNEIKMVHAHDYSQHTEGRLRSKVTIGSLTFINNK